MKFNGQRHVVDVRGLTCRYQRHTPALPRVVDAVALALADSAGSLLLVLHQMLSWTAVLNHLMLLGKSVGAGRPSARAPVTSDAVLDDAFGHRTW